MKSRNSKAFTLVELLVVIIIIGILAAVAIPQFGESSLEAKKSALKDNLRTMRSAVESYNVEHTNMYPGVVQEHKDTAAGVGAAHTDSEAAFVKQLTAYSDLSGNTCDEKNDSFPLGPYIRMRLPDNPLPAATATTDPSGVNITTDTTPLTVDGTPATGWKYSSETGEMRANNSDCFTD